MKLSFLLKFAVLILFIQYSLQPVAFSQDALYLEDEGGNLWEEQRFLDITGEEFTTEDSQYVGEEEVKAAEEAARLSGLPSLDLAAALERDKEMLPDNIMYGIGTGALIGGWFALVQGDNARDNVRYLTIGTLLGALLGIAIGNKSMFMSQASENPSLIKFAEKSPAETIETDHSFQPNLIITPEYARLDFQIHF